jgi:type I restriction enzyme M protein
MPRRAKKSVRSASRAEETKGVTTSHSLASLIATARKSLRKDKGLNGDLDRLPLLTWVMFLKFLDDAEITRESEAHLAGERFHRAIEKPYRWRDWAADPTGLTGDDLLSFVNDKEAMRPDGTRGPGLFAYLRSLTSSGAKGVARRDVIATVFRGVDNRMKSGHLLRELVNKIAGIHFTSSEELHTLGAMYESMLREMRDAAGDSGEFYTPRPVVRFMVETMNPRIGELVLDPAAGTGGFLVEAFAHLSDQVQTVRERRILQHESLIGCEAKPLPYLLCQMNLLLHGLDTPNVDPGNALRFRLADLGPADRADVILTNPPFGGEEEKGIQGNFPPDKQTAETALLFLQLIMRRLRRQGPGSKGGRAAVIVPNTTLFYPGVASRLREELIRDFCLWGVVRLPKGVFEPYTDIETNILFFDASGPTERVLFYQLMPPNSRKQYSKTQPLRFAELQEAMHLLRRREDSSPQAWYVDAATILDDPRISLDLHNPKKVRSTSEKPLQVAAKLQSSLSEVAASLRANVAVIENLERLLANRSDWKRVRLADVLRRRKDECVIEDDVEYKRLRIQVKGRGVVLRDQCLGKVIGTKRQFVVEQGQFVLSKIDARNGAFGIVPEEAGGAVITGNFWAYDVDDKVIQPQLLHHLTRSDAFMQFCAVSSPGATNRRYLQENLFLEQTVTVPAIDQQKLICDLLSRCEGVARGAESGLSALSKQSPALLQSCLHQVFGGAGKAIGDVDDLNEAEQPEEAID